MLWEPLLVENMHVKVCI